MRVRTIKVSDSLVVRFVVESSGFCGGVLIKSDVQDVKLVVEEPDLDEMIHALVRAKHLIDREISAVLKREDDEFKQRLLDSHKTGGQS